MYGNLYILSPHPQKLCRFSELLSQPEPQICLALLVNPNSAVLKWRPLFFQLHRYNCLWARAPAFNAG